MANIFHIERVDNKITLGTTDTTINIASHTASSLLGLDASKNLESITIPLAVTKGGTGVATLTDGGILYGNATDVIQALPRMIDGMLAIGYTGANPVTARITPTVNQIIVTNGHGSITLSTPQDIHTGASPTFASLTLSSIAAEGTDVDKFLVDSTGVIKYRTGAQVLSDIGGSASGHTHDDRYYTETEIDAGYQPLDAGLTSL